MKNPGNIQAMRISTTVLPYRGDESEGIVSTQYGELFGLTVFLS